MMVFATINARLVAIVLMVFMLPASGYDNPAMLEKLALLERHDPEHFPKTKVLAMLATEIEVAKVEAAKWKAVRNPEVVRCYFQANPLEVHLVATDRPDVVVKRVDDELKIRWSSYRGQPARVASLTIEEPVGPQAGAGFILKTLEAIALRFAEQPCPFAARASATPRELLAEGRRIADDEGVEIDCGNRWRARITLESVAGQLKMAFLPNASSDPEKSTYQMIEKWRLVTESILAGDAAARAK